MRKAVSVMLREDITDRVRDKLAGTGGKKIPRGAMQNLIETLLVEWLRKQEKS